jgi:RHS repeat-associated protein
MLAHYVQKPQKISSKNASELGIFKTRKGYLETYKMGCLKLTYHQDFLHVRTETALEKSDHETALPHGKKDARDENCVDYYPFGLTFNSYQRENSVPNRWKFQSQEHIDDLGLNWDQFKWRNHQPDIGRFFNIDPLASKYVYNSPYAFSENKVTHHIELEGAEGLEIGLAVAEFKARTAASVSNIQSAGGRLVSGNSGNVPKDAPVSGEDRQMIKTTGQLSDAKQVTDGVKDISKTGVKMGAEGMQGAGQAIEVAGIVTGQPEIAGAGEAISNVGKGVEMAMDASEGNLKAGDVAFEVGKQVVFKGMGKGAEKAAEAGNLDKVANNIFQGFVKGWEMATDWAKGVVDDKKK